MVKLFSKNSSLCDHNSPTSQTYRQTDRQTDDMRMMRWQPTALCTKVHRAVKTVVLTLVLTMTPIKRRKRQKFIVCPMQYIAWDRI